MKPVSRSTVRRLALVALDVLVEACRSAGEHPVDRTSLHRLALGYLLVTGCATAGHAKTIWHIMGHEGMFNQPSCRQAYSGNILDGIRLNIEKQLS